MSACYKTDFSCFEHSRKLLFQTDPELKEVTESSRTASPWAWGSAGTREPLELGSEAANRRPTHLGLGLSSSNEKPRANIVLNMTGNGKVITHFMSCWHCYVYSFLYRA